jgi:hypothetical protein
MWLFAAALGCSDPMQAPLPDAGLTPACDDADLDTIGAADEGSTDFDGDGIASSDDLDSDGDGIWDRVEAGDLDCETPPADLDEDGAPNTLDLDSNGDGIPDAEDLGDLDGDLVPDAVDPDIDGDGIANAIELAPGPDPPDTDGDGEPDVRDLDSDGDAIPDRAEGAVGDVDGDGIPCFRDLDSDGDGVPDATEGTGDPFLGPPPVSCELELALCVPGYVPDGYPDAFDRDSDNDGVEDSDEIVWATDRCNDDTDRDGISDLFEVARMRRRCPGADKCDCATDAACGFQRWDAATYFSSGSVRRRDIDVEVLVTATAPADVTLEIARDPADDSGFDGTALVERHHPACDGARDTSCWTAPDGVLHGDAVASVDAETFYGVAPGTRLRFRLGLTSGPLLRGSSERIAITAILRFETSPPAELPEGTLVVILLPCLDALEG